jgi:hypothetical protein
MSAGYLRASVPPCAKCACPVVKLDQNGLSSARSKSGGIIPGILSRDAAFGQIECTI